MSDPISQVMELLQQGGWDRLEHQHLASDRAAERGRMIAEAEAVAGPVAETFSTPAGRQTLAWLIKQTLLRSETDAELAASTAEAYAILKARRAGQNQVVTMILQALEVARGGHKTGN